MSLPRPPVDRTQVRGPLGLRGEEGATFALLIPRLPVMPHVEVADQLAAALEGIKERNRTSSPTTVISPGSSVIGSLRRAAAMASLSRVVALVINCLNGNRGIAIPSHENGASLQLDQVGSQNSSAKGVTAVLFAFQSEGRQEIFMKFHPDGVAGVDLGLSKPRSFTAVHSLQSR